MSRVSESKRAPLLPVNERPTFYDLEQHAEAGLIRRGLRRYFVTRNYERSIKIHTMLGAPLVRKVVLKSADTLFKMALGSKYSPEESGYRLDKSKPSIDAANSHAFKTSVWFESAHLAGAAPSAFVISKNAIEGGQSDLVANGINVGIGLALVGLQRYNRARLIKRMDEQLAAGDHFSPRHTSWTGIDARAAQSFNDARVNKPKLDN